MMGTVVMTLLCPQLFALKKYELKTVSDPQAYRWKCKLGDLTLMTPHDPEK